MMRNIALMLLAALALTACGKEKEQKPLLEQERRALEQAKQINEKQLQEAQKLKQQVEKQQGQ